MKKIVWIGVLLALPVIGFFGYRLMHPSLHMHFVYRPVLLTDEQTDYMRTHPNETPMGLTGKETYMKHVNLVLQIRNEGEIYTGGVLRLHVEGSEDWREIQVSEVAPKNSKDGMSLQEYMIPLGIQNFSQSDKPIHVDIDVFNMWVAERSGGRPKSRYFRPNFRCEYYLRSDAQIERVGDVAF